MKFLVSLVLLAPLAAASAVPISPSLRGGPTTVEPRAEKVSYDGYRVYRVAVNGVPASIERQLKSYHTIHTREHIEVAIPPAEVNSFEGLGLDAELINDDLGRDIAAEATVVSSYAAPLRGRGDLPDLSWFDAYHPYDDHVQYWEDLQAALPDNSKLFDAGPSYEGRSIFGLQLWGGDGGRENSSKPIIYWHATVHAREWISTAVGSPIPAPHRAICARLVRGPVSRAHSNFRLLQVIEYLTYQLIDGYLSGDEEVLSFLDYYDFYIVPFHNPDGK